MEKTAKKSWTTRAFLISLAALILCSVVNWGVITGWGNVKITKLKISGDDGLTYTGLMYIPKSATNATPAPGALFLHGNSGNARNHESWAVEYARRGFVVISVDNLGAADGEFRNAYGSMGIPTAFMNYMLTLNYVDKENILASGHSMGGGMAYALALNFPENVPTVISSNAVNGMNPTSGMGGPNEGGFDGNMLIINGTADKMNENVSSLEKAEELFNLNGGEISGLEIGKLYGSFEEGNAMQYDLIQGQIHEAAFINHDHIAAHLDFAQKSISAPNPIDSGNQIWQYKDVLGLLGMLIFASAVVLFALMLVEQIPFFASIKQPLPQNLGLRGPGLAISVVCATVFPVLCLRFGGFGLVDLFGSRAENLKPIFSLRFTNIALATVLALNIFGFIMLFVYWFTDAKKHGSNIRELGLTSEGSTKIDWVLIGKSLLLAVLAIIVGWTYLALQGAVFGTDFYCLFFGFKPIATLKFKYYIPYLILWMLSFVVAAIGMNVERRLPSTGNEAKDTLIAMVVNIVLAAGTITAMVFVENAVQISLGSSAVALSNWGTDITRLWGMPVGMVIGAGGNTYCFRKTGNVWLGAFLMGLMCALASCLYGQVRCF